MSIGYRVISWSPYKRVYDLALAGGIIVYLATFFLVGKLALRGDHAISNEILLVRAVGTSAFLLLSFTLCIGPLARLNTRFLPLLYNRRHLGVATFLLGLVHAAVSLGFYHGFGRVSPLISLLTSNSEYRSVSAFPFEMLGLAALLILFVMAATSHDFWLKNLSPGVWKALHMFVYVAWALLVLHVALGALQSEKNPLYAILLIGVVLLVTTLHVIAGRRERKVDLSVERVNATWVDVCDVQEISEGRGKAIALPAGERVAVFRYGEKVSAINNVCAHQGGPLGEGKIIDGCVTCPWHGYQYRPDDGCAPPPFTEKLPTYAIRVENGRVLVNVEPLPPGTPVEPAVIEEPVHV